ncbi:TonB-dependent receptor [Desulfococcaceae bacterium HSG7]|nr:TonB-dependent receptor [Desulfococcaceae bacterium HSG9]MDM8554469.1 TonB-dependent receptor [Desulfococcaceae bacterium HSG7]
MKNSRNNGLAGIIFNLSFCLMLIFAGGDPCSADETVVTDLTDLSIQELMNVEITLAARKPRKLSETSAAVFMITAEDIRRSGVTSIPEALRMVPGLQVARIGSGRWAITSRGFNSRFAYKLLVLIDGRSVYTPVFSGVFWENQDVLLEDIDRIEIIRGPGASLWGANAVNGIINIITKHSKETQGNMLTAGIGSEEKGFGSARNGGKLGESGTYRLYAKYFNRDEAVETSGKDAGDDWDMLRAGFRSDFSFSDKDEMTLQGDIYQGEKNQTFIFPSITAPYTEVIKDDETMFGGNILGRWQRRFSDSSDIALQFYYSHSETPELNTLVDEDTYDMDFQHRFVFGEKHELSWGLGYRFYRDNIPPTAMMSFEPREEEEHLFSAFVQDDFNFIKDRVRLTLGTKVEYNESTDFEIQPNARVLLTPHKDHILWAAVSRAVKTPSRLEKNIRMLTGVIPPASPENPTPLPVLLVLSGNSGVVSQEVVALESGYRLKAIDRFSFDMAVFYNLYDNLIELVPDSPYLNADPANPAMTQPTRGETRMEAETWGIELAINWELTKCWQVKTAYTLFQEDMHEELGLSVLPEDRAPRHQVSLRSSADLPWNLEFDLWFRYVDELSAIPVESYSALDLRLGWNLSENIEISIAGQSLTDPEHPEFYENGLFSYPAEIERSLYAKIVWRF